MEDQLPLFSEPEDTASKIDVDAIAARIAANARYTGSKDRTSEAAHDQGYGAPLDDIVIIEGVPETAETENFTMDTRFINGESYICAIDNGGNIISKRGLGNGSPELYGLVEAEATRILSEK